MTMSCIKKAEVGMCNVLRLLVQQGINVALIVRNLTKSVRSRDLPPRIRG